MGDRFYDLKPPSLLSQEEEDDTDYDALNNETFGEDALSTNWEQLLEQSSEMATNTFDDKNEALCQRITNFLLEDDEGDEDDETIPPKPVKKSPLSEQPDSSSWWKNAKQNQVPQPMDNNTNAPVLKSLWDNNQASTSNGLPMLMPSKPPVKILTVEELERKMRQEAESKRTSSNTSSSSEEMNMDTSVVHARNSNGQLALPRPTSVPPMIIVERGRFSHEYGTDQYRRPMPEQYQRQALEQYHRPRQEQPYPRPRHEQYHRSFKQAYQPYPDIAPTHSHRLPRPTGLPRPPGPHINPRPGNIQHQVTRYYPPEHRYPQQQPYHRRPGPHNQMMYLPPQQASNYDLTAPVDEYAGLMSPQEKQWLASIQMMQLNSTQLLDQDYYYTKYLQRQQGNSYRKQGGYNSKNNRDLAGAKTPYTPLQFENSLGKLQIGSVTAPRKIIEMELVENVSKQIEKKSKQILMEIELLYLVILKLEDILYNNCPIHSTTSSPAVPEDPAPLQDKLLGYFLTGSKLISAMAIKKGKNLLLRTIPVLNNPSPLIHQLLLDLVPVSKKDTDPLLLSFLPAIRNYLASVPLNTLVQLSNHYQNDCATLLSNKFTVSVMANFVERADQLFEGCDVPGVRNDWCRFLLRLVESNTHWTETERPVVAVDRSSLIRHLQSIENIAREADLKSLVFTLSNPPPHQPQLLLNRRCE